MSSFDSNGNYNKTNWKTGDKITADKLNKIEESLEIINNNDIERHKEADERLDALEDMVAEVEGDLEGLHAKDEEISEQLTQNTKEVNILSDEKINVKSFGAKGDSITDDTEAIQSAIDYVYNQGYVSGGTVYFPKGVYVVSDGINIRRNINLKGAGISVSVLKLEKNANISTNGILNATENTAGHWSICDLSIDGNKGNNTVEVAGIYCNRETTAWHYDMFATIKNVEVFNCTNAGIFLNRDNVREMRVLNCKIHGNKGDGLKCFTTDSFFDKITSCNNDGRGFQICGSEHRIVSCKAYGNKSTGFTINNCGSIELISCSSQENMAHGFFIDTAHCVDLIGCYSSSNGCTSGDRVPSTNYTQSGVFMTNSSYVNIKDGFIGDFRRGSDPECLTQRYAISIENGCRFINVDSKTKTNEHPVEDWFFIADNTLTTINTFNLIMNGTCYDLQRKKALPRQLIHHFEPNLSSDDMSNSVNNVLNKGTCVITNGLLTVNIHLQWDTVNNVDGSKAVQIQLPDGIKFTSEATTIGSCVIKNVKLNTEEISEEIQITPYLNYYTNNIIKFSIQKNGGEHSDLTWDSIKNDGFMWLSISGLSYPVQV